ncbi:Acidic repeat containing, partial [Pristimantis euphronides]
PLCGIKGCFLQEILEPTSPYVTHFQENKDELIDRLYRLYNTTLFKNQLPKKMKITWNKRLTATGGQCSFFGNFTNRKAQIELAAKICDSADRLENILVHEMCHAACWLIHADNRSFHEDLWKSYAELVTKVHPELSPVSEFHVYSTNYPFLYGCTKCGDRLGRFHRIPTNKAICKKCNI